MKNEIKHIVENKVYKNPSKYYREKQVKNINFLNGRISEKYFSYYKVGFKFLEIS